MKFLPLFILMVLGYNTAMAQQITSVREIGPHFTIFNFEKNENPQNVLVVYTKLDANCHVEHESNAPVFDMYWLMDRKNYKPTHSMIKSSVKDRLQLIQTEGHNGFYVQINDLKEVNSDIQDARLSVVAEKYQGKCRVRSLFTLGPSDNSATIELKTIYSEATKTVMPPFRKLKSVTLIGVNTATGEKISRKYLAK